MDLYSDGCMNGDTGDDAWASVTDSKSVDLVAKHRCLFSDMKLKEVKTPKGKYVVAIANFNDVASKHVNGAELMAMVMALRIATVLGEPRGSIHCDSSLIVKYWSLGGVNPSTLRKMDERKKMYVNECKSLREEHESLGGKIVKIPGKGNPADLGYHK
jgi:ribonuclease HI